MQLDPTRWLVSLAGFIYDWIITREWKRFILAVIPVFLMCSVMGLVLWGKNLDSRYLAQWYSELGDEEIAGWESAWSGNEAEQVEPPAVDSEDPINLTKEDGSESQDSRISPYADMLFQRVQLLEPSVRSQFVIGAMMAQRGALEQGKAMLSRVAPDDKSGYAPAHAMLVSLQLWTNPNLTPEMRKVFRHHVSEAKRWNNVPQQVLLAGYKLCLESGDSSEALRLIARAADRNPAANLTLFRLANEVGNERMADQAAAKAEEFFRSELTENPKDDQSRVLLVELLILISMQQAEDQGDEQGENNRMEEALTLLKEGAELERTPKIARALSEFSRIQFRQSLKIESGAYSANMQYLDLALRHDPTNPLVGEEIARLAGMQGPNVSEEMIDRLRAFIAEGKATTFTHALIAETYLVKDKFARALPHLEQVIIRLPTQPDALNNLAIVLLDLHPDRIEEALGYAQRAVAASAQKPNADYFDTLGTVLSALDKSKEAIAAFETAVELLPKRKDFHERLAAEYRKQGDAAMADIHDQLIEKLSNQEQADAALRAEEAEAAKRAAAGQNEAESPTPIDEVKEDSGLESSEESDESKSDSQESGQDSTGSDESQN